MQILKTQRKRLKGRIGISGPSGSGKTYSALIMAHGIVKNWEKICVIDTEVGSSNNYSHLGEFNVLELTEPFSPERFIEAIKMCEDAGMEAIIIDSASHEWEGKGGCLEINDELSKSKFKGNTFAAWSETTPRHQSFIEAITQSKSHIITTSRSKTDMVIVDGKPKKVGTKDIQREGFEYEMTLMFNLERDTHKALTSKDRTGLFIDRDPFIITEKTGEEFGNWLESGVDPAKIEEEKKKQEEEKREKKYNDFLEKLNHVKDLKELKEIFEKIKEEKGDLGKHMVDDLVDRIKDVKMDLELTETAPATKPQERPEEKPTKTEPKPTQKTESVSTSASTPISEEKNTTEAQKTGENLYHLYLNRIDASVSVLELKEMKRRLGEYQTVFSREEMKEINSLIDTKITTLQQK